MNRRVRTTALTHWGDRYRYRTIPDESGRWEHVSAYHSGQVVRRYPAGMEWPTL